MFYCFNHKPDCCRDRKFSWVTVDFVPDSVLHILRINRTDSVFQKSGIHFCQRIVDRHILLLKTCINRLVFINLCFLKQALLMRPLGIGSRGRFLFVTTSKKKTGFLLIETFRKDFITLKVRMRIEYTNLIVLLFAAC